MLMGTVFGADANENLNLKLYSMMELLGFGGDMHSIEVDSSKDLSSYQIVFVLQSVNSHRGLKTGSNSCLK